MSVPKNVKQYFDEWQANFEAIMIFSKPWSVTQNWSHKLCSDRFLVLAVQPVLVESRKEMSLSLSKTLWSLSWSIQRQAKNFTWLILELNFIFRFVDWSKVFLVTLWHWQWREESSWCPTLLIVSPSTMVWRTWRRRRGGCIIRMPWPRVSSPDWYRNTLQRLERWRQVEIITEECNPDDSDE